MRQAGILKHVAVHVETIAFVKPDRADLRVQCDFVPALSAGASDQFAQQGPADTAAATFLQYRHTADLVLGGEPAAADRLAAFITRQHMPAVGIKSVPLALLGHTLFLDEYSVAQVEQGRSLILTRPVGSFNVEVFQLHRRRDFCSSR